MEYKTDYLSVVLMGKIASGKGTQANAIAHHFGGVVYSNGNKLREVIQQPSPFGKKMKEMYEEGLLMPEWIASYWMTHALVSQYENERVIFEAVARKPNEAALFHEVHEWVERPYIVFNLDVPDEVVRERSLGRARDVVDSAEKIEKRLAEYREHTTRSIEFFRAQGTVIDIDGTESPEVVQQNIFTHLQQ